MKSVNHIGLNVYKMKKFGIHDKYGILNTKHLIKARKTDRVRNYTQSIVRRKALAEALAES